MPSQSVTSYLKEVQKIFNSGDATEHTYRPALKSLVESFKKGLTATNEPKRVQCGAPDYIVTSGQTPLGYIEAKDVSKNLDEVERSEQMKRYLQGLGNLILTDYLDFRWYENGEYRMSARLGRIGADGKFHKEKDGDQRLEDLFEHFLNTRMPSAGGPKELAGRMAALARILRDTILRAFEGEGDKGTLHAQFEGFRDVLLHTLEPDEFADMYAQTICYGLFAAKCNHVGPEPFSRQRAAYELPKTNPFLRQMFNHIAGPDLDDRLTWAVDHLAELLNRAEIDKILEDFGKRTRQEDPVVHFYETFLAAYDPKMRKSRGVYYTPEPVVSYIVRSVDHILKNDFELDAGLADTSKVPLHRTITDKSGKDRRQKKDECHKVLILDPAVGTGTFLHGVVDHIHEQVQAKGQGGMWSGYVSEHLLPRLFGFEVLMAPYAVAHMKLGLQLKEMGYDFGSDERLRVYLTNTLEKAHDYTGLDLFASMIAKEANSAGKVKTEAPVMVVLGNPPYSGHSANKGQWLNDLMRGKGAHPGAATSNYFMVDGKPLGERNPKWLNDDYVKFIRFAQWRIEQTGYGILAFISNHGYLDNPTFRGMRQSLMKTFDDIYVLDLHGNSKKKEVCPDGSKDQNVFDIQQGVAIGIFVKKPKGKRKSIVQHADLWGVRDGKYPWLYENDIASTGWTTLQPQSPYYLFIQRDTKLQKEYERGWKVTDALPLNGVGMTTARDGMVIDFDEEPLLERAKTFRNSDDSDAELCRQLDISMKKGWNIPNARGMLQEEDEATLDVFVKPITYRPFDERLIFYHDSIVWRTVKKVMHHMLAGENVGLISARSNRSNSMDHFLATKHISETKCGERTIQSCLFPLYLYPKGHYYDKDVPLDTPGGRRPNLAPEFVEEFAQKIGMTFVPDGKGDKSKTFGPEDIFSYMYAVFHCPTYRTRYADFLKIDFPRLPITSKPALFRELCALGERLVALHLMEEKGTLTRSSQRERGQEMQTQYPVSGDNVVDKIRYTEKDQRVWVNKTQYFEGVPKEVYEFHVGGYQVCHKWLKDRRGRILSYDDLNHYQQIVSALGETIVIMADIDQSIEQHGGWPIK